MPLPWLDALPRWSEPLARLVDAGGIVLVAIAAVAMVLFALVIERWWYFRFTWRAERKTLVKRWVARREHTSWSALTLREMWTQELIARLQRPLPWLKLMVMLCPLLGLLGTVTGMIVVFDGLAMSGANQERAMADGVARATLPTMVGMAVAVAGLLFATRLEHIIRREGQRLHDRLARATEDSHA